MLHVIWFCWIVSVNMFKQALAVIILLKEVASLGNKCQIGVGDSD